MTRRRHKKIVDPKEYAGLSVIDAVEKFMPDHRTVITRFGDGISEPGGRVEKKTKTTKYRRFPIAWGFPMDELGFSYWFIHIMQETLMPWDPIICCVSTYLPQARSFIHESFVKELKSSKYLVMLDSDVIPPPGSIEKLIEKKLPLVGGWYRKKGADNSPVVYDQDITLDSGIVKWKERKEPGKGLEKVDGAGAGFWVMRRDVAEAIGERPYDELRCGEDLEMCLKVREAGYNIYIDWDLKAEHRGVMSV